MKREMKLRADYQTDYHYEAAVRDGEAWYDGRDFMVKYNKPKSRKEKETNTVVDKSTDSEFTVTFVRRSGSANIWKCTCGSKNACVHVGAVCEMDEYLGYE